MDAAGPLHDLGEARRRGAVDLDELDLHLPPLAIRRRVVELAGLAEVVDVARQGVVAHEERSCSHPLGERSCRGSDVGHGVRDLHDAPVLESASPESAITLPLRSRRTVRRAVRCPAGGTSR